MTFEERYLCFAQDKDESRPQLISREEVSQHLQSGNPMWIDILEPTKEDTAWLKELFEFHDLALEDVLNNGVRPKIESYDDVLFTVFGAVNFNPGEDELDTVNLNLFLKEGVLVTAHCKPLRTTEAVRKAVERKKGVLARGADYVYYLLLDGIIDRYFVVMDEIETGIEDLERQVFDQGGENVQAVVFDLKRKVAFAKRSMGPKRDALRDLVYDDVTQIRPETRTHMRDVLDHVLRINDNLDSYRELLNGLMDSYMSQISNRMNEVMKLLSIIATLMLPLSFLTGLFGMNFDEIPGLHWKYGFWALAVAMTSMVVVLLWFFKRKKML